MPGRETEKLPCPRCGAAAVFGMGHADVRCAYCGGLVVMPSDMRARAEALSGRVALAAGREALARTEGETLRKTAAVSGGAWRGLAVALGINAVVIGVGWASIAIWKASGLERVLGESTGVLGLFVLVLVVLVVAVGLSTRRHAPGPLLRVGARCGSCGGDVAFESGSVAVRCPHCAAGAIAGKALAEQIAGVAEARADAAVRERVAAGRAAQRALADHVASSGRWATLAILWSAGFPGFGLLIWCLAAVLQGDAKDLHDAPWAGGIGLGWLGLVALGWWAIARVRGARPRAIRAAMTRLAERTAGELSERRIEPALDWLDAHWPEPAPAEVTSSGGEARWTLCVRDPHPTMIVAIHGPKERRAIHVLVAAPPIARLTVFEAFMLGWGAERSVAGVAFVHYGSDPAALDPQGIERLRAIAGGAGATAAEPEASAARSLLLRRLLDARAFRAADLEANRHGRMSPWQRGRAIAHALIAVAIAAGLIAWGIHVLTDDGLRDRSGHLLPFGERVVGSVIYFVFAIGAGAYALWRARVAASRIVFAEGPVRLAVEPGHKGSIRHVLHVGTIRLVGSDRLPGAVLSSARYRAYFAAAGDDLLSLEPISS